MCSSFAEETNYTLEPIVVVPTKSSLAQSEVLRKVIVIDAEQIAGCTGQSLADLFQHVLGVDIRRRGALGVQSDINMRAAGFEQVVVAINGIRLNDPQTGHHNMDLPVTLLDVERVEILPGQGSSLYGSSAFGGTINIVTKKPKDKGVEIETTAGSFDLNTQSVSFNSSLAGINSRVSFARQESGGYRPDTDFKTQAFTFNAEKNLEDLGLEYLFGYTKKDFGAYNFYSESYPHQEEHTDTRFFSLKAQLEKEEITFQSNAYYRRHSDKFILDRTRPSWYVNYHTTYVYGADLEAIVNLAPGTLLAGVEARDEKITSTNLGAHQRDSQAIYFQFQTPAKKKAVSNLSLRFDHYQTWGWQASPAFGLGCQLSPALRIKASGGRSFRIPSFTDLYYQSVENQGNKDLTPEKAFSWETGLDFDRGLLQAELTYFQRYAQDSIGWLRSSPAAAWQAQNISEVDTQGLELDLSLKLAEYAWLGLDQISAGYVYQYSDSAAAGLNTKYTLDFLKHHAYLAANLLYPGEIKQNLRLSYKQKEEQRPYFLLDTKFSREFKRDAFDLEVFLDITNLFNTSYAEQGTVSMPGRWIIAGMRAKL